MTEYTAASPAQQAAWTAAYEKAVANATFGATATLRGPAGRLRTGGTMIIGLTSMARSGALDGALLSSRQFYGTDYTKPLLFIADGTYLANLAQSAASVGRPVGDDERDRELPGSGVAVALHPVVPGPAHEHLVQR